MSELNLKPVYESKDGGFILFLSKRDKGTIYDLYFMNNCKKKLSKVEVIRKHSIYNNFLEANFIDTISTKEVEDIRCGDKFLVGYINEQDIRVDEFEFTFNIYLDNESFSFNHSINRKELLLKINEEENDKVELSKLQLSDSNKFTRISMDNIVRYFEKNLENKASTMDESEWLEVMRAFNILKPYIYENEHLITKVVNNSLIDWYNYFS